MTQLANEIHHSGKENRQALAESLFKDGTIKVKLSAKHCLAMKADLQLPWTKLRIMRRYYIPHLEHEHTLIVTHRM